MHVTRRLLRAYFAGLLKLPFCLISNVEYKVFYKDSDKVLANFVATWTHFQDKKIRSVKHWNMVKKADVDSHLCWCKCICNIA